MSGPPACPFLCRRGLLQSPPSPGLNLAFTGPNSLGFWMAFPLVLTVVIMLPLFYFFFFFGG